MYSFDFEIIETLSKVITIKTDCKENALEMIQDLYDQNKIHLDEDDHSETKIYMIQKIPTLKVSR